MTRGLWSRADEPIHRVGPIHFKASTLQATMIARRFLPLLPALSLFTPGVGHTVVFGVSDNSSAWWDNSKAAHLKFRPRDSADADRARIEALPPLAPNDPAGIYQGGSFVHAGPFED